MKKRSFSMAVKKLIEKSTIIVVFYLSKKKSEIRFQAATRVVM
ncbi:MAG: hypothetical protein PHX36_08760 [Mesotoga sp.]|nr:hypothetical protein [Mesotoga sp.]